MKPTNEHNKPPKEYIELLEKRLYVKETGIENRLKDVQETIINSIEPGKKRFQKLQKELDKSFPPNSVKPTGVLSKYIEPNLVICGQQTNYYNLSLSGKTGMILIVFRPHGVKSFFNFPITELLNERENE